MIPEWIPILPEWILILIVFGASWLGMVVACPTKEVKKEMSEK